MRLLIENPADTAVTLLRRAGYVFQREENSEMSFIRALGRSGYPRFHCYARSGLNGIECHFHLDQKRETYGRATRHHGEYAAEGPLREELLRIQSLLGASARIV